METTYSWETGGKGGTSRLLVGGIHGQEGSSTIKVIEVAKDISVPEGRWALYNFPPSPYLSTLDPLYYLSLAGSKLVSIIQENKPDIFLELHCYHPDSYFKLTKGDRKDFFGVPGLVELENGVLMGSVSPLIRSVFFALNDFPFVLEIPCNPSKEALKSCQRIMEIIASSSNRREILQKLGQIYPRQVQQLDDYFKEYTENFHPAFVEIKKRAMETDLKSYQDLDKLITEVVKQEDYDLNPRQIKQLEGAFLICKEYSSFRCCKTAQI
ncbi:DUF2119 domain-containing protein [Methanobacterium formicicum]|uniref:DUF2119 domain-containing protein n=1 Tax=Methanobacterium formicicum TaxID=2162 RepID=UPI002491992C|nr:DUF2119 domain-containing protein [Methanobacterium formicicum]